MRRTAAAKQTRRRRAVASMVTLLIASSLVASLAAASRAEAVSYQDWPTYLHDAGRSNATADPKLGTSVANLLKLKWAYKTGGPIATSASIVGTTAYIGSWDGYEYALSTTNGALVWRTYLGLTNDAACHPPTLGITSAAAVVNGVVYVGGGDTYWYALDATTGAVLWKVFTGDNSQTGAHYNWASPLIVNGAAYVGVASNCDNPLVQGHLMKIDLASHQVVADYNFVPTGEVGGGIWTSPAYDSATNTVYVTTGTLNDYTQRQSQAIVALDATTLVYKSSWQLPFNAAVTDSDWGTTPTLLTDAQGRKLLVAANKNGVLYAFDRTNLAAGPVWFRAVAIGGDCPTCGDGTISSGIFANGVLYYAGGNNLVNGQGSGGSITAFDPATGNVLWTRQTDSAVLGSPAYVNGLIGLVEGSTFEVVDASNGRQLYSYVLPATVYGAVSVARSQFYVGAIDGNLYALGIGASPSAPPNDPNCPSGFTCQDVRNPLPGSEQSSNGVLTVTASGAAIHGTSDQFRFISKPVTGDSESSVRIVGQSTQNQQPQAGLMVRQPYGSTGTDPTAPFYGVLAYPNDLTEGLPAPDIVIWYRTQYGQNSIELTKWYPAQKPVSVMIQRQGNLFSAGISFDGTHFQVIPGTTVGIDLPATTQQGLAVDSGSATNYGTASFTNLAIGGPIATLMTPQPPPDPCPQPWTCTDIGNPNPPGDTLATGSTVAIAGTGTGFGGSTDSFHYAYQTLGADASLSAQVVTSTTASNAQDGLMMRASTAPDAPMYSAYITPGKSLTIQWRTFDDIKNRQPVAVTTVTSGAHLQIVRYTDTRLNPPQTFFSTLTSTDGVNWTPVLGSTVAINMGSSYLAGVAGTLAVARTTLAATFNAVTLGTPASPPPGICPQSFSCSDVGVTALPGNEIFLNNTLTMRASGSDIWSSYDTFRFDYQPFPADTQNSTNGDGTISARVVSQTSVGGPWMKSGVMIRAGTDPQAPYYGIFVTPANGVVVQYRAAQAAQSAQVQVPTLATPVYVLASRYTDTAHNVVYYSAFTSTDGSHFTFVPGSTIALGLPGPLVAGVATDSYNSGLLSVATFDNITQLSGSQPPPNICPSAWQCADVDGALPPGQDQLSGTTWNEVGGGGDIWGTDDSFHFVSQPLAADGSVTAHIVSQQPTDPWAKAGPMLRATADPGSPYYAVFVTPANGIAVQWRATQGATTNQVVVAGSAPAYLQVVKYTTANPVHTYLTAYSSNDGVTWTPIPGSTQVVDALGTSLLGGFGITSHEQGVGSAVQLDTVSVVAGENPPPGLCPAGWTCADLGGATPTGTQDLTNGQWTIAGGGGDIWGTADAFRFIWQSMAGDGTVSAQLASQSNTDPWAKAGVMLRATSDPSAPYYAIFVTPGNGVVVQWRAASGAATNQVAVGGTVPLYVRITRTGTTFSADTSTDGATWTPVPNAGQSIPALTGALLEGLAVTSHNTGALSTVAMSNVVTTP